MTLSGLFSCFTGLLLIVQGLTIRRLDGLKRDVAGLAEARVTDQRPVVPMVNELDDPTRNSLPMEPTQSPPPAEESLPQPKLKGLRIGAGLANSGLAAGGLAAGGLAAAGAAMARDGGSTSIETTPDISHQPTPIVDDAALEAELARALSGDVSVHAKDEVETFASPEHDDPILALLRGKKDVFAQDTVAENDASDLDEQTAEPDQDEPTNQTVEDQPVVESDAAEAETSVTEAEVTAEEVVADRDSDSAEPDAELVEATDQDTSNDSEPAEGDDPEPDEAAEPSEKDVEAEAPAETLATSAAVDAAPEAPAPADVPPSERVVGRYRVGGRAYTMFADGTVEAVTEHGVERFKSMEDLRTHLART
jgi:hypothetical protein